MASRLSVAVAGLAVLGGLVAAQPAPPSAQTPEQRLAPAVSASVQRLAMLDLRLRGRATPEDYRLAARVLEAAQRLTPEDPELARRIAAAAFAAGDEKAVLDQTRRIVRLDPEDTVAQLRLITALIGRLQTGEERLAAYDRYLGPAGERLDPSVRSRLALDAALLARELGETEVFIERLTQATRLDVSNKDAAAFALRIAEEHGAAPEELIEYQVNLLYADPLDPNVMRTTARTLASAGAYPQARRLLRNAQRIASQAGQPPPDLVLEGMILDAIDVGPRPVLNQLEATRLRLRQAVEARLEQAEKTGEPTDDLPKVDEVTLPLEYERVRLMLAASLGEDEIVRQSLDELEYTVNETIRQMSEQAAESGLAASPEVQSRFVELFLMLQTARALLGVDLERMQAEVDEAVRRVPSLDIARRALDPWIALHEGDPGRALAIASDPALTIQLARGVSLAELGRTDEAIDAMLSSIRSAPYEPSSVWAALRVIDLAGESALTTDAGRRMGEFLDRIPSWMDRMIDDASRFESLTLRADADAVSTAEPARVSIGLRNMAPIPLGVGADRPISSRFLLTPSLDDDVRGFVGMPLPEVLELDRRLRLAPGEQMTAHLPADSAYTDLLVTINAELTIRQRWRLLQSFRVGRLGAIVTGPMALTAETGAVRRLSVPEARLMPEELTLRVRRDDALTLPRTLVGIRARLLGPRARDETPDEGALEALVAALIDRYDRAGPIEKALLLAELPHGRLVPAFTAFDQHAIGTLVQGGARDPDGLVAMLVMLTRTPNATLPVYDAARATGDPALSEAADLLQARFGGSRGAYAIVTDFERLSGPVPTNRRPSESP